MFIKTQRNPLLRVRFAPSPTGNLHIGGMRTALFNWLFARSTGSTFVIRVEDTDPERSKVEFTQAQVEALAWCGIQSDEPLVFQSQRNHAYQEVIDQLLSEKKAYRCYCSPEAVEARIRSAGVTDEHFKYDGLCRTVSEDQHGKTFVIRVAFPEDIKELIVQDLIRGTVTFESSQFDDFIIARSDGSPMYNFAVVVDDAFQKITHVIRGEEHLGNTPKQMILYRALGLTPPQFAHIPLILSPDGGKLSKRDGAVDVLVYKQEGYLADALVNYIVRLGWSHGDQELFTREELIEYFSLQAVGKKGAVFDIHKLQWINATYIKQLSAQACFEWLCADVMPDLMGRVPRWNSEVVTNALALYKDRVKTGKDLCQAVINLHNGPKDYAQEEVVKWMTPEARIQLKELVRRLTLLDAFTKEQVADIINTFCKEHEIKLVALAQPIRIALTGGTHSPGVFDLLALVAKAESLDRMHALLR